MPYKKWSDERGDQPPPEASPATLDPYIDLGAAMVVTAVKDLQKPDPIESLDAFIWLVYGDGPIWLEYLLGSELSEEDILQCLGSL